MTQQAKRLSKMVAEVAAQVPPDILGRLADDLEVMGSDSTSDQRRLLVAGIAQPGVRDVIADLFALWESCAPGVNPSALSLALRSASEADESRRDSQSVELVWTGPVGIESNLRRTDQVLLDLIQSARKSLFIVSFAAYDIPEISGALLSAANRGVHISLVLESADASDGKVAFDALAALGEQVARMSSVYVWPLDKRPRDGKGRHGSLHVKCAVADESAALISSANLTGYAMNLNMELGILIRGGDVPSRVSDHLHELICEEVLVAACGNSG